MSLVNVILSSKSIKIEPVTVTDSNMPIAHAYGSVSDVQPIKDQDGWKIVVSFSDPDKGAVSIRLANVANQPTWTDDQAGALQAYNDIGVNFKSATGGSVASSSPFVPMTMLAEGDNEFMCMASVIMRPTGYTAPNDPIIWQTLTGADGHGSSLFRGHTTTGTLRLIYPEVKNVCSFLINNDDAYRNFLLSWGASVGTKHMDIYASRPAAVGWRLQGNGTTWVANGNATLTVNSINGAGTTAFDLGGNSTNVETNAIVPIYVGDNNYRVKIFYGSIAGSAGWGFQLVDIATNTVVTTPPTSSDVVIMSNAGVLSNNVGLTTWSNPFSGQSGANNFMNGAGFNFWCIGMFELWMKVLAVSSTELLAKWQAKSGVTSYKLKRSTAFTVNPTTKDYVLTSPTTVYTGTALQFADTGLTPNTMYYYQLTDQADVEITQFNTKTKAL